ncbi:MAG: CorA family divalent cation transporter, partial [Planctomycetota bacterium]
MAESVHSKLSDPPGDSPSAGPTYLPEAAARGERFSVPRVGSAPGIEHFELSQMPSSAAPVAVTCIDYSPDRFQIEEVHDIPGFLARHRPPWSVVRWIRIEGLTDMRVIHAFAEKYELHPLAIEDVLHLGQRPKCEDYPASEGHPGRLFVVAALVERATSGRLCTEQMSMFLGRNTLVTMHERPSE